MRCTAGRTWPACLDKCSELHILIYIQNRNHLRLAVTNNTLPYEPACRHFPGWRNSKTISNVIFIMSLTTLAHSGPATSTGPLAVTTLAHSGPATSTGPLTVTALAHSGPATSTGPLTLILAYYT